MKRKWWPILASTCFCCVMIASLLNQSASLGFAQESTNRFDRQIETIFSQMTPDERVGQLFMVTIEGHDWSQDSIAAQLIRDHRVGGVWLRASNHLPVDHDASSKDQFLTNQQTLINQLQGYVFQNPQSAISARVPVSTTTEVTFATVITGLTGLFTSRPNLDAATFAGPSSDLMPGISHANPIPLFIATESNNHRQANSFLRERLRDIPSGMAIGATWNVDNARSTGQIVGQELSAVGINMLFGPILDVLDNPNQALIHSVGVQSFGGDPFWVGKMGQAYIQGLHLGSNGALLTIAKHFPGVGSIDRLLNEDVATVQKSIEALSDTDLAPFYAVTSLENPPEVTADGLMTAHIRYKGLQENIRESTQPISLDAQNLPPVLAAEPILSWRKNGGLVVSGPLGAPAIQKTFATDDGEFPAIPIARHAFLAGNDLLLLSTFGSSNDSIIQFGNIKAVLEFFVNRYNMELEFQQQVDQSVKRILRAKLDIYDLFAPENVLIQPDHIENLANNSEIKIKIAREAVTLFFPGPAELADRLPSPPLSDETIVIFTDSRPANAPSASTCGNCDHGTWLSPTALQQAILARYGPESGNQINANQLFSFTFLNLADALDNNLDTQIDNLQVLTRLSEADWVIFAMLDADPIDPTASVVKRYLKENARALRGKKLIVLAFDAPYYLDETEVSVLTAYYGLYNMTQQHIDAAVRVLFKEFHAQGHSPVSIDAVEYDIRAITKPNPDQTIVLAAFSAESPAINIQLNNATTAAGDENIVPIAVEIGNRFTIRTDVIQDHNGNPVPDGTPVYFYLTYLTERLALAPVAVQTEDGLAETMITVERGGILEIRAETVPGQNSTVMVLEAQPDDLATLTASEVSTSSQSLSTATTDTDALALSMAPSVLSVLDLFYTLLILTGFSTAFLFVVRRFYLPLETQLNMVFNILVGGLLGYVLYGIFAIQLVEVAIIGAWVRDNTIHHRTILLVTIIFAAIGGIGGLAAWLMQARRKNNLLLKMKD